MTCSHGSSWTSSHGKETARSDAAEWRSVRHRSMLQSRILRGATEVSAHAAHILYSYDYCYHYYYYHYFIIIFNIILLYYINGSLGPRICRLRAKLVVQVCSESKVWMARPPDFLAVLGVGTGSTKSADSMEHRWIPRAGGLWQAQQNQMQKL